MLLICDFRQILPIVEHGDKSDIIGACIASSHLWQKFTVLHLTMNMRVLAAGDQDQISHAASILALGEGRPSSDIVSLTDPVNDTQIVGFCFIDYFLDTQHDDAIAWLYNRGFANATIETLQYFAQQTNALTGGMSEFTHSMEVIWLN
jgi:hypothetical protein